MQRPVDLIAEEIKLESLWYAPEVPTKEIQEEIAERVAAKHGYRVIRWGNSTEGKPFIQVERM